MVGVVGKPDAIHGEEVVAFVSLRNGQELTGEELVDWARSRIGGYKYPREVRIVDSIPLTPVGKIDRKLLRSSVKSTTPAAETAPTPATTS
jgi:long-chain acyl-CoA synthetase